MRAVINRQNVSYRKTHLHPHNEYYTTLSGNATLVFYAVRVESCAKFITLGQNQRVVKMPEYLCHKQFLKRYTGKHALITGKNQMLIDRYAAYFNGIPAIYNLLGFVDHLHNFLKFFWFESCPD